MSMKRCDNGHYYDASKHTTCPSCGVQDLHVDPTVKKSDGIAQEQAAGGDIPTRPRGQQQFGAAQERDPGATVGVVRKKLGIDPVVGWLVCIEGAERGRDYRIRSERNFIGRDPRMDICIGGDDSIARENHAILSFNPKKLSFLIMPGDARGIVYLNDAEVATPADLKPYDVIELGQTKLLFVPFCGEKYQWS